MNTSQTGLDLIKDFEGFRDTAYADIVGVWTVGYGFTRWPDGFPVKQGDTCTREKAEACLKLLLHDYEEAVSSSVHVPISQDMFDALISFSYNLGIHSLQSSTLIKLLNQKKYAEVPTQFLRWSKAGGKVVAGLLRRRRAEAEMFRSGISKL